MEPMYTMLANFMPSFERNSLTHQLVNVHVFAPAQHCLRGAAEVIAVECGLLHGSGDWIALPRRLRASGCTVSLPDDRHASGKACAATPRCMGMP